MRSLATVLAFLTLLASSTARADEVDDLVAAGENSARRGEYSLAIDRFKQADAGRPRALHACLIALAYLRRELWAQAEIALATCHTRASDSDPLPPWVPKLTGELATSLGAVDVAPVAIRVDPPSQSAAISISSFSPDEVFTPRVLHLAPGTYVVTAHVPGRGQVSSTVVVVDRTPQTVTLRFVPSASPSRVPWLVVGAGGLLAAGGLAIDLLAVQRERDRLERDAATVNGTAWRTDSRSFDRWRAGAIGLFAGAAVVAVAGVALRFTLYQRKVTLGVTRNGVVLVGAL